jgi:hypothetical protein
MENELIRRGDVIAKFAETVRPSNNSDSVPPPTWNDAVNIVHAAPAVDAVEVRHAYWIEDSDPGEPIGSHWACSECNICFGEPTAREIFKYCPHCGARMDGEEEHNAVDRR